MGGSASARNPVWACALLVVLCTTSAGAVLVHGEKPLDPSDPSNDLPRAGYVGQIGLLSGVYLGDGWVLTAHHVTGNGTPDFVLEGTSYPAVAGSGVWLEVRPGTHADLQLFRLANPPKLSPLSIARKSPALGTAVVMIGKSSGTAGRLISWDTQWKEVKRTRSAYLGYRGGGVSGIWWGRNTVSRLSQLMKVGPSRTRAFGMRFDRRNAVPGEAAVLSGDSGGAVFAREEGVWRLAGILFARETRPGQADNVAVFGDTSLAADLSFYRTRIRAVTTRE